MNEWVSFKYLSTMINNLPHKNGRAATGNAYIYPAIDLLILLLYTKKRQEDVYDVQIQHKGCKNILFGRYLMSPPADDHLSVVNQVLKLEYNESKI